MITPMTQIQILENLTAKYNAFSTRSRGSARFNMRAYDLNLKIVEFDSRSQNVFNQLSLKRNNATRDLTTQTQRLVNQIEKSNSFPTNSYGSARFNIKAYNLDPKCIELDRIKTNKWLI